MILSKMTKAEVNQTTRAFNFTMKKYAENRKLLTESENGSYVSDVSHMLSNITESTNLLELADNTDFVVCYREDSEYSTTTKNEQNQFISNLKEYGVEVHKVEFQRDNCKVHIWRLRGLFDTLCDVAEDLKLKKETTKSDIELQNFLERNFTSLMKWFADRDPFVIRGAACQLHPLYFVATFNKEQSVSFRNFHNKDLFFSHAERIRMVHHICDELGIHELIHKGIFTEQFALHQGPLKQDKKATPVNLRQNLEHDWANWSRLFKYQPLEDIKNYFGEKIGLYFVWLGFYTSFLIPAAIVGVLCFLYGMSTAFSFIPALEICNPENDKLFYHCPLCDKYCSYFSLRSSCLYAKVSHFFDNEATIFFATFMSFWATLFLEFWKRKQATLAYKWHTISYEDEEERPRPQYIEKATRLRKNLITQTMEPVMPKRKRIPRIFGAIAVVAFFVAMVLGSLIGVIIYRAVIYAILLAQHNKVIQTRAKIIVSGTAAFINLIVINIMRIVYSRVARTLTNWENPRTLTDYEDSFTLKMFWFQFVNTYSSVFYVAFFKNSVFIGRPGNFNRFGEKSFRLEGCSVEGCFLELCVQLTVIMVGQQVVGNIGEVCLPLLKQWYHKQFLEETNLPQWEEDYDLEPREELSLFWEYLEIVLQYGFVTMFVAAFPLAPLFALMNNVLEIRVDAINFLCHYRRPVCHRAEDIGAWYPILTIMTEMSVLINALVIAFTSDFVPMVVYKHIYSKDGTLHGYVNHSLSYFNVSDFNNVSRPEEPNANLPYTLPQCRYPGYYEPHYPYDHSNKYYLILSVRLAFVFLFQWSLTGVTRILAWYIPDVPSLLKLKIKRENYLANEALRNFKVEKGVRKRRNILRQTSTDLYLDEDDML